MAGAAPPRPLGFWWAAALVVGYTIRRSRSAAAGLIGFGVVLAGIPAYRWTRRGGRAAIRLSSGAD